MTPDDFRFLRDARSRRDFFRVRGLTVAGGSALDLENGAVAAYTAGAARTPHPTPSSRASKGEDMSRSETAVRRRLSLSTLVACLALGGLPLAAGCGDDAEDGGGSAGGEAKQAATVNVASFKFLPDPIKVKAGGTLTWVNKDRAPHTAETERGTAGGFDTRRLDTGETKAVRLDRPGTLTYFCVYHRFMEGTVEVVE